MRRLVSLVQEVFRSFCGGSPIRLGASSLFVSRGATLAKVGLPIVVVNPRQVRDFAKALGRVAKPDALDAALLAEFAQRVRSHPDAGPLSR